MLPQFWTRGGGTPFQQQVIEVAPIQDWGGAPSHAGQVAFEDGLLHVGTALPNVLVPVHLRGHALPSCKRGTAGSH